MSIERLDFNTALGVLTYFASEYIKEHGTAQGNDADDYVMKDVYNKIAKFCSEDNAKYLMISADSSEGNEDIYIKFLTDAQLKLMQQVSGGGDAVN